MPHLPVVMPLLLQTSQSPEPALREVAVEQLGHLVSIMGLHVRSYLPSLLALARDHLKVVSSVQTHCISLLEHLCKALADEFGQHLPPLMPRLLAILHSDRTERRLPTQRVLHALETFNQNIHNQLHLVVPAVMRLCEQVITNY
jgi:FKBP12-rapamycin complex-associated protein